MLPDFPPLLSREFLQEFLRRDLGTQFNQSYLLLSLLPSCLCLFYLMWSGTLRVGLSNENNPFLKVLLLAAFKPQLYFFSLCPTSGQADKEARFFLLWHQWEIRRMQVPCQAQILIPGPPPNHNKNPDQSPVLVLSSCSGPAREGCPALPRDLSYIVLNFVYVLLVCV